MFERLSYKRKFILVIAGGIVMFFLVFKLNIKKTIVAGKEWRKLKNQTTNIADINGRNNQLENRLLELNDLLGSSLSPANLRASVLTSVVELTPGVKIDLYEIPKVYTYYDGDMEVYTNKIVLKGDFKSLLKYLYLLETKEKISRIRSVNFIYTKQRGTQYESMYAEFYLQNIKIESN